MIEDILDPENLARAWTAQAASAAFVQRRSLIRRSSRREDKQWKQPRTRRRKLLALGVFPEKVHLATRSRKGYWRMSRN